MTTTGRILRAALWVGPFLLGLTFVLHITDSLEQTHAEQAPTKGEAKAPERLDVPGIENAFRLSPRLYSGGEPRGSADFEALRALGVRTIITVDGAQPDVETARKYGIRYVHLPVGYDGIPREQAVRIVAAAETLPGPVFVHCHHGLHRGPTAAALCGIATEGWGHGQALAWLELAGTSPDYRGLFASARSFVAPSAEEVRRASVGLPERVEVSDLVEMMVQVGERWDQLKAIQKAGFKAPADQPDIDPPHEALQLSELFQEAARLAEVRDKGEDFTRAMETAWHQASALQEALKGFAKTPSPEARKSLEAAFGKSGKSCTSCHANHRDNRREGAK